jgi:hypothetical protein
MISPYKPNMIDNAIALPTVDIVPVPVGMVKTAVPLIAVALTVQVPEVEPVNINPPAGNVTPVVPSKIRLMLITPSTHPMW